MSDVHQLDDTVAADAQQPSRALPRDAADGSSGLGQRPPPLRTPQPSLPNPEPVVQAAGSAPGYGYGSNVIGDTDGHLRDYVKVIYKRRWTTLAVFLAVFIGAAIYTFTATPIYQATVQILIDKEATNLVNFKEAIEQNRITDDYYQTQYKILQSRALARRTLEMTKLWTNPQFMAAKQPFTLHSLATGSMAWLTAHLTTSELPEKPAAGDDGAATQSTAIDRFVAGLRVTPVRNSRLVDVTFESPQAAVSAQVVNTLATSYIAQNLEVQFTSSKEASDWLGQRLGEQKTEVETSEQALQKYREQTDSVSLEDKQNIVVQRLADLSSAVTRVHTERIQKETLYKQIHALQDDRAALDTIPAILSNGFIQQQKGELADLQRQQAQLSDKLGPHHPDMVKVGLAIATAEAKIQVEVTKVIAATQNEYEAVRAQEQSLVDALELQKRDALALNRKGIDYGTLQRDAASNRQIFDSLMQRTKETGISTELRTSNIRIIDAAEIPRRPASPNVTLNLLLGLFGGLTLALALTFFFEYMDDRIKSPNEVALHLGLPFIGLVPALFDKKVVDPLMSNAVPPQFAEAFRAIRSNVLFSSAEEGSKVIVVTSTAPGEGKTLVASNLAVALAQANQRVLIIDGDMRKPRVHGIFGHDQEPGLSNVLVGNAKPSDAVRNTGVPGLWALPAGVLPPNPSELLASKRFRDFIGTLGQHFDWVIIDSPPVMAVTDSAIVAHIATGVVFVIGSAMTSRHTAQRSLEQLRNANAQVIGAILNRVDLQHHGYYYSQYYKKSYAHYYARAV